MNRNQTTVVLGNAGFRAALTIAIFDTFAALLLAFGSWWQSPSFSTAIAALIIAVVCLIPLVTVLRRTYTRSFLNCFAVMTVVLVLVWTIAVTFALNKERTTSEALVVLLPVSVVVGGIAQFLLKRALGRNKTNK